jgi:GTP diphosphokinase / guanosine-3',5'-bis(diphosphate) 3'-diphosphatase
MMVEIHEVKEIRPRLQSEFDVGEFVPRTETIAEAYRLGQQIHGNQKRLSGEPYFETHCGWVGGFMDRLVGNEAWTIAGLLHDTVEDSGGDSEESLERIRQSFPGPLGEEVAHIVDGMTKLSNPRDGRSRELETLRKIAMFRDPGIFLVKLADKSHNVMTLEHMPPAKRRKKAEEAIRAYGKLAGILNCYTWRRWLEDTAFPFYDPHTFNLVRAKIDRDPRFRIDFINSIMHQLGEAMQQTGLDGRVEIIVNGYWQSWQKLRQLARLRKASLNSFAAVNDLISFRLVLSSNDARQCYQLLASVNRLFGPYIDQSQFDDYIANPQNGYRALHVTAWMGEYGAIEVAIATDEMEGENLWGIVYALRHHQDISTYRPIEILTPTGGARFLPEGSTVLDAVASIQREFLLDKISAVKVNGALVHLSDHVKPGDVVEVITNGPRLAPAEEWLKYGNIFTTNLLRAVLATESLRRSAETGRQMVKERITRRGLLALEDVYTLERDKIDNLLERLSCASLEDFYSAVGGGAVRLEDMDESLTEQGISKDQLGWTTINIEAAAQDNRPGVLSLLSGLISNHGGNIMRSVNDTQPDGGFLLRVVVKGLTPAAQGQMLTAFQNCGIRFRVLELV